MNQQSESQAYAHAELLRVTLDSIGDAVITTDTSGNITSLNPTAQSLTGWRLEETAGRPLETSLHAVHEITREAVENPATRSLRGGVTVGLPRHTLLIARDGTERPIDGSAAPVRNEAGEVAGVVLVFRDATEDREQVQRVQDALDYAENILATGREPLLVLDRDLRVITANRSFYRVFQVTAEETEHRPVYELGDGQWDIPQLRTLVGNSSPAEVGFDDLKVAYDFPTIGRRVMLLNVRRLVSGRDQTEHILLAIQDVTERERALGALADSELKYRRLFEAAEDGILILDATTGQINEANPFIQDILGRSREDLLGMRLWEIGSFANIAENEAKFVELRQRGHVRYDHLPIETEAGRVTEVEFVSNVYEVDGRQVIQCNIRDISERRKLERETERQAQELAELGRRKDEFLAMLSHELRNPLAPITSAVRLLRMQTIENAAQRQAREVIERQVAQLVHLVNDLLEISRIATGRIQLQLERIDLRLIVERGVEATAHEIERRRHELRISVPAVPVWVNGDPVRLEEVVVNLLANAAKYTDDGGQISITVQQQGDLVTMRVQDTGVGIAPELLPHIFELFTQGEHSLARSEGGLGVGLALVKQLTEMHGGSVDVHDAPGRGSEFVVRLPAVHAEDPQPPPAEAQTAGLHGRPLRILVVDDNEDMARLLQLLIEEDGHATRLAFDGQAALVAAVEFRPDVVLLDIGLPGWDGYEVARRIRREPTLANVTLVAITGYGRESDRAQARDAGFDHFIVKPPDFDRLQEIFAAIASR